MVLLTPGSFVRAEPEEPIRRIRDKLGTGSKQNASSNTPNKLSLVSTAVVALLLHSRCREFDPLTRHHYWGLSSVGRASDLHSEGSSVRSR